MAKDPLTIVGIVLWPLALAAVGGGAFLYLSAHGKPSLAGPVGNQKQIESNLPSSLNALEAAILPTPGSASKWNDFVDDGGLRRHSTLLGVSIKSISTMYADDGKVGIVDMKISKDVSSNELRKLLQTICGFGKDDWKIERGRNEFGEARGSMCKATYVSFNNEMWEAIYSTVKD